jgi:lipopolysaccharide export system protein LptC
LLLAIVTNFILEKNDEDLEIESIGKNDPDLYMLNATITQFNESGNIQNEISADRFTHFPLTDMTALISPNMRLFPNMKGEPWDIEAKKGRLLSQSTYREQVVELWDDVLAIQQNADGSFIHIQTQSLTVYPEREFAETDQKVYIDDNSGRTTAAGMKAYFDKGKFVFYSTPLERVHTIFLPEFKGAPSEGS